MLYKARFADGVLYFKSVPRVTRTPDGRSLNSMPFKWAIDHYYHRVCTVLYRAGKSQRARGKSLSCPPVNQPSCSLHAWAPSSSRRQHQHRQLLQSACKSRPRSPPTSRRASRAQRKAPSSCTSRGGGGASARAHQSTGRQSRRVPPARPQ